MTRHDRIYEALIVTARVLEYIADELDRINAKHNHHMKEPTR